MLNPYWMSGINMLLLVFFCVGLLLYKAKFPRRKLNLLFVLIILSLIPTISIFRAGAYESGDFNIHIYRAIDFYNSLSEGNLMPSWAANLNAKHGYPLFVFLNSLPYYFVSLFHFLGFSFVASLKILIMISYIFSGIFMFLFAKKVLKKTLPAFCAAIFYQFSPYHLIDMHFRVDIGEILIFATFPLLLYSVRLCIEQLTPRTFLFVSISTALVIFSHQAMAFLALLFSCFYFFLELLFQKRHKTFLGLLGAIGLGVIISSYLLFPYLYYTPYLHTTAHYKITFTTLSDLLFSPWRGGLLFQGPEGQISSLIGYTQLFIVLLGSYLLIKRKILSNRSQLAGWLLAFFIIFFMMLPISSIVWETIPLIGLAIISTRVLLFASLITAMIAGFIVLSYEKKKILIFLLISVTILQTILNWGTRRTIPEIGDNFLIQNTPLSSIQGEGWPIGIPKWINPAIFEEKVPTNSAEIILGNGSIVQKEEISTNHVYKILAESPLSISEKTWYFPGWEAKINNIPVQINYTHPSYPGLINLEIPRGNYILTISYSDPLPLKVLKTISLVLLGLISLYFLTYLLRKILAYKF